MDEKEFGQRIRRARENLRMTQEELAVLLGKDQRTISQYERGEYRVSAIELPRFATALQVSISYFFEDEGVELGDLEELALISEFRSLPSSNLKQFALKVIQELRKYTSSEKPNDRTSEGFDEEA